MDAKLFKIHYQFSEALFLSSVATTLHGQKILDTRRSEVMDKVGQTSPPLQLEKWASCSSCHERKMYDLEALKIMIPVSPFNQTKTRVPLIRSNT